jgi:hypothetical protein
MPLRVSLAVLLAGFSGSVALAVASGAAMDTPAARASLLTDAAAASGSAVYWGGAYGSAIGRTSPKGLTKLLKAPMASPSPCSIAATGKHVYWSDNGSSRVISRATFDGRRFRNVRRSFIRTGAAGNCAEDIVVDARHIYWISGGHTIGRARLNGRQVTRVFIRDKTLLIGALAINGTHIYWGGSYGASGTEGGAIASVNVDGSGVTSPLLTIKDYHGAGLAVNEAYLFWSTGDAIARSNLDGSAVTPVLVPRRRTARDFGGIAVDAKHLYWSSYDGPIGRSTIDGLEQRPAFIRTRGRLDGAGDVAVVPR